MINYTIQCVPQNIKKAIFMDHFKSISKEKLVDKVINQLKESIANGTYKTGDKIPNEIELMSIFSVGRSTIREAVKTMANMGLLEVKQGRGTFVLNRKITEEPLETKLRRSSLLSVYEVRRILELEITKFAAERRTDEQVLYMESCLEKRLDSLTNKDFESYIHHDMEFHLTLAYAAHNMVLVELYLSFSSVLKNALKDLLEEPNSDNHQQEIHENILKAVKNKDVDNALFWASRNIDKTTQQIKKLL